MSQLDKVSSLRQGMKRSDDLRDANKLIPDNITIIKNLSYSKYGEYSLLDIYSPKDKLNPPTLINIHGGGFCYGTKETYLYYCTYLASLGYQVISFSYRLAPEFPYPSQLEDINQLFLWMKNHQETYHFNFNNLFLIGDSAGASLASQFAIMLTNHLYALLFPFSINYLPIKGLILNCGFYSLIKHYHEIETMREFYLPEDIKKQYEMTLNTLDYITKDYPSTFIASSNGDFLLAEAKPFYHLLKKKKVDVTLKIYQPEDEILPHVFHCDVGKKYANIANREEMNFVDNLSK